MLGPKAACIGGTMKEGVLGFDLRRPAIVYLAGPTAALVGFLVEVCPPVEQFF